jgi:uncharacterized protein YsxB (DUF464 family)
MIQATIFENHGDIIGFEIKGHAGYAAYGNDVVCAAVSSVAQTIEIGIIDVLELPATLVKQDGYLYLRLKEMTMEALYGAQMMFKTLKLTLEQIQLQYDKYLQICLQDASYIV